MKADGGTKRLKKRKRDGMFVFQCTLNICMLHIGLLLIALLRYLEPLSRQLLQCRQLFLYHQSRPAGSTHLHKYSNEQQGKTT